MEMLNNKRKKMLQVSGQEEARMVSRVKSRDGKEGKSREIP